MSQAIVFDSAGTLLKTIREVTDVTSHQLLTYTVETTLLTSENPDRLLVILNFDTNQLLQSDGDMHLSSWMKMQNITFGISFGCSNLNEKEIEELLHSDTRAKVGDLQLTVRRCHQRVELNNYLFSLNGGLILNTRTKEIEFCIASAGQPFSGVKELISQLHQKGISTFIASGDRTEKLELVADTIGIPRSHVLGVATPKMKEKLVLDLKKEYDSVIMVGDGINDIEAMHSADISILTTQQNTNPPEILRKSAKYVISDIKDVIKFTGDTA